MVRRWICFSYQQQVLTSTDDFNIDLYAYDFRDGETYRPEDGEYYNSYTFSPAKDQIVYNIREGEDTVLAAPIRTNGAHAVEIDREILAILRGSPDGAWIAYLEYESTPTDTLNTNILIARSNALEIRQVTNTPELEQNIAWSPDSEQIAFVRRRYNEYSQDLHVINIQSGKERLLDDNTLAESPSGMMTRH